MKKEGEKITWLTAYDYPTAQFEEAAGVDMILVGDSMGMCVYGYENTVPVAMEHCIVHSEPFGQEHWKNKRGVRCRGVLQRTEDDLWNGPEV